MLARPHHIRATTIIAAGIAGIAILIVTAEPSAQTKSGKQAAQKSDWLRAEMLYSGTVAVTSSAPGSTAASAPAQGKALLRLNKISGNQRVFWLHTSVPALAAITTEVPGAVGANGAWSGTDGAITVLIARNGDISATGADASFKTRMRGAMDPNRLRLNVEMTLLKPRGGTPAGSRHVFEYDLRPVALAGTAQANPTQAKGSCRKVVWKLKTVANLQGGPMQTVRVPVCEK